MALRLAFMGTPDFAVPTLKALIAGGHEIAAVYSQPPRPAGRGHRLTPSPVHRLAEERGIETRTPTSLRSGEVQDGFRALRLDAAVVVAYGLLLPTAILAAPRRGCVNLHASLLPRWRGAAPIQRAILEGDSETGVTVMVMDEGLDTGAMLATARIPIGPRATATALSAELAQVGAALLPGALEAWCAGRIAPVAQPEAGVTYAAKISRADAVVDWTAPAERFDAQVRALTPWPGVSVEIAGERVKVLACELVDGSGDPGYVIDGRLTIAFGKGAVRLTRLQRPNRGPVDAAAFLAATPVPPGTRLV